MDTVFEQVYIVFAFTVVRTASADELLKKGHLGFGTFHTCHRMYSVGSPQTVYC